MALSKKKPFSMASTMLNPVSVMEVGTCTQQRTAQHSTAQHRAAVREKVKMRSSAQLGWQ